MATLYYSLESDITLNTIHRINKKLLEKYGKGHPKSAPIHIVHNLVTEDYAIERMDEFGHWHYFHITEWEMKRADFCFNEFKRYGDNDIEIIARPLIDFGNLTLVSEHDDRHPLAQVREEEYQKFMKEKKAVDEIFDDFKADQKVLAEGSTKPKLKLLN